MKSIYVLAEIGVNHDGSVDLALEMVRTAALAGANGVKFQTYNASLLASENSPSYWDLSKEPTKSQIELFKRHECPDISFYIPLIEECNVQGIDFNTTCFDEFSLSKFAEFLPFIKISSSDITNFPLIELATSFNKPLVLSCGASSLEEIKAVVRFVRVKTNVRITLLHCVLNYPCRPESANLACITTLMNTFKDEDNIEFGYSCHVSMPYSIEAGLISKVLGSTFLEKHYTTSRLKIGNDHYHSWTAEDLLLFRNREREVSQLLGDSTPDLESQALARLNARRSLYLARDVYEGKLIEKDDLISLRPYAKVCPTEYKKLIGQRWASSVNAGEAVDYNMIRKVNV